MIYNNSKRDFSLTVRGNVICIKSFEYKKFKPREEEYLAKTYSFLEIKEKPVQQPKPVQQVKPGQQPKPGQQVKPTGIIPLDPNTDNVYDVSVLIPAWKTAEYIEECLDSVYKQRPLEILVGVDGCQETLDKLLEIKYKYPNLKVFWSEENVGCYLIRNSLFRESVGNKIIFFDSDDIMMDELIPTVCHYLDEYDVVRFKKLSGVFGVSKPSYNIFIANQKHICIKGCLCLIEEDSCGCNNFLKYFNIEGSL